MLIAWSYYKEVRPSLTNETIVYSEPRKTMVARVGWFRPPPGCLKLNTDNCQDEESGFVGIGVVLIDEKGDWVAGFTEKIRYSSIEEVELWGLERGLKLAWDLGVKNHRVEVDSIKAVQWIKGRGQVTNSLANLVELCGELMEKQWSVHLQHVYHEGNKVPDPMARIALTQEHGVNRTWKLPPRNLEPVLQHDVLGMTWPRYLLHCN